MTRDLAREHAQVHARAALYWWRKARSYVAEGDTDAAFACAMQALADRAYAGGMRGVMRLAEGGGYGRSRPRCAS